jgi:hypothetical protein
MLRQAPKVFLKRAFLIFFKETVGNKGCPRQPEKREGRYSSRVQKGLTNMVSIEDSELPPEECRLSKGP